MKAGLLIIIIFGSGVLSGVFSILPDFITQTDYSTYVLYILLFAVGAGMGGSRQCFDALKNISPRILLIPFSVVAGSLVGAALASFAVTGISIQESMGVVAGFGYYSLSSILIKQIRNETLGVIALLSNLTREIVTLLFAPFIIKYFGRLAGIAAGGATSMDTTLPVITKFSGAEAGVLSVFSGVLLTFAVPFIISFIFSF